MTVAVLQAGSWGTTLATILARDGGRDVIHGDSGLGTVKGSDFGADNLNGGGGNDALVQGDCNDAHSDQREHNPVDTVIPTDQIGLLSHLWLLTGAYEI